ncbi:hypothetical protein MNBD_GAMMA12-1448 [hydrothermal vent metagenome]|uniref:MAPEG family protein n=1 Tax=hydrothermal vent metagenome TaxID=652676 RepID=A0A3B0YLC7_9ZZZZ
MQNTTIFFPVLAMAFWTFGVTFFMGRVRFRAVRENKIDLTYFKINHAKQRPETMVRAAQHYNNLFEINSLFYPAVIVIYLLQATSLMTLLLAWGYFISRVFHSLIHLGKNDVQKRFIAFLFSLVFLLGLWIVVLLKII